MGGREGSGAFLGDASANEWSGEASLFAQCSPMRRRLKSAVIAPFRPEDFNSTPRLRSWGVHRRSPKLPHRSLPGNMNIAALRHHREGAAMAHICSATEEAKGGLVSSLPISARLVTSREMDLLPQPGLWKGRQREMQCRGALSPTHRGHFSGTTGTRSSPSPVHASAPFRQAEC
jgi:hypothetical protein